MINMHAVDRPKVNTFIIMLCVLGIISIYGCSETPPLPPAGSVTPVVPAGAPEPVASADAPEADDTAEQAGYEYDRRNRRDPFSALISPVRKLQEKDASKLGTLEGYDLGEFRLSAIANKGDRYYALLITPDNRSFTVYKGAVIGLNRGKIKKITDNKVVLVEYTRNYKDELQPREIILEFHKGETD